jgi:type I restriction enzyme S subunit
MTVALDDDWPAHWERSTLGEIATVVTSGSRDWKPYYNQGTGVFILTQNVRMRALDLSEPFHVDPPADDPARKRSAVQVDDLLINIVGGVGTVARVDREVIDHYVCQSVALVRLADPSLSRFVEFYLSAPSGGQRHFAEATYGIGRPHLSFADIKETPVPIPPDGEREELIGRLDLLSGQVAEGDAHFLRARTKLTQLRVAVLGELEANGSHKRIDEVGEVFLGATPSRKEPALWKGDVPWVSSGEVAFCRIATTKETISPAAIKNPARRIHPPGTVLLAMYGEGKTRGQAAVLDISATTNQAVAAIRLDPEQMIPEFLYLCLMHKYEAVRSIGHGGQQINLSGALVKAIEVPCPTPSVQQALVSTVRHRLAAAEQLSAQLVAASRRAAVLHASITRTAFTGRLSAAPVCIGEAGEADKYPELIGS